MTKNKTRFTYNFEVNIKQKKFTIEYINNSCEVSIQFMKSLFFTFS